MARQGSESRHFCLLCGGGPPGSAPPPVPHSPHAARAPSPARPWGGRGGGARRGPPGRWPRHARGLPVAVPLRRPPPTCPCRQPASNLHDLLVFSTLRLPSPPYPPPPALKASQWSPPTVRATAARPSPHRTGTRTGKLCWGPPRRPHSVEALIRPPPPRPVTAAAAAAAPAAPSLTGRDAGGGAHPLANRPRGLPPHQTLPPARRPRGPAPRCRHCRGGRGGRRRARTGRRRAHRPPGWGRAAARRQRHNGGGGGGRGGRRRTRRARGGDRQGGGLAGGGARAAAEGGPARRALLLVPGRITA